MFDPRGPSFLELARQALSSTERGYDLLAPKFDYTPFRTPDWLLERVAFELGPQRAIGRALDLCCGTGAAIQHLRVLCRDEIVGLDRSAGMLDEARKRTVDAPGTAQIRLVMGDALDLPFDANPVFELATCFGAFGHILPRDEARFVQEIARVLVPGGQFVFVSAEMPSLRQPERWVAEGFNAAMRVRNALIRPPFIMYYLTFLLPDCARLLETHGFDVEVRSERFAPRAPRLKLVVATRRT